VGKKLKLSQWHDGNVKPVHVGFYNVRCHGIYHLDSWSYWNGKNWTPQNCSGIEFAMLHMHSTFIEYQNKKWRGIVK